MKKRLQIVLSEKDYVLLKDNVKRSQYLGLFDEKTITGYLRKIIHAHATKMGTIERQRREEMDNLIEND